MKVHVINKITLEKRVLEIEAESKFHAQLIASNSIRLEVENPKDWYILKVEE